MKRENLKKKKALWCVVWWFPVLRVVRGSPASNTCKWHAVILGAACLKQAPVYFMCCFKYLSVVLCEQLQRCAVVHDTPCCRPSVRLPDGWGGEQDHSHFLHVCLVPDINLIHARVRMAFGWLLNHNLPCPKLYCSSPFSCLLRGLKWPLWCGGTWIVVSQNISFLSRISKLRIPAWWDSVVKRLAGCKPWGVHLQHKTK